MPYESILQNLDEIDPKSIKSIFFLPSSTHQPIPFSADKLIPIVFIDVNRFSSPSLIGSSGGEPGRGTRGAGRRKEREQHGPTCKRRSTLPPPPPQLLWVFDFGAPVV